ATSTSSLTSTSTIHQAEQGVTTISQTPITVTQYSISKTTTTITRTVLSSIPLPATTQTVYAPRCDDARYLIGNVAFYPSYSGSYGSETISHVDSASSCCAICAEADGCVSWFFDVLLNQNISVPIESRPQIVAPGSVT